MIHSEIFSLPLSFILGVFGAWLISRRAVEWGLMDYPDERKSHNRPTPRGGGVGIGMAFMAAAFLCNIPWAVYTAAIVLALTGLADDHWGLPVKTRFCIQIGCALFLITFLHHDPDRSILLIPLGIFWVLYLTGTANFFNFMDGIDGNAAIGGTVAFVSLAAYTHTLHMPPEEFWFNLSVAASCLGFLPFNIRRKKVFMGDTGSVLLGFLFAVQVYRYAADFIQVLILSSFLFLFYLDTLSTLYLRWREGEELTRAHRRHLYQIAANQLLLPHWKITLGYGVAQAVISATFFITLPLPEIIVIGNILVWLTLFVFLSHQVRIRAWKVTHGG